MAHATDLNDDLARLAAGGADIDTALRAVVTVLAVRRALVSPSFLGLQRSQLETRILVDACRRADVLAVSACLSGAALTQAGQRVALRVLGVLDATGPDGLPALPDGAVAGVLARVAAVLAPSFPGEPLLDVLCALPREPGVPAPVAQVLGALASEISLERTAPLPDRSPISA